MTNDFTIALLRGMSVLMAAVGRLAARIDGGEPALRLAAACFSARAGARHVALVLS